MQVTLQLPLLSLSEGTVGSFWCLAFDHVILRSCLGFCFYCYYAWHFSPLGTPNLSTVRFQSEQLKGLWIFWWWINGDREKFETLVPAQVSEQPACHGQYFPFVIQKSLMLGDKSLVFYCICPFTWSWDGLVKNKANLKNDPIGENFQERLKITLTCSVRFKQ